MEKLTMQRLRLENFQKFKQKEIEFGEEQTVIRGGNGQGKTTVYSAMTWLLFGKDYKGSTDTGRGAFDIKHREGGLTVDHTDTSVEGEFTFNGRHLRLKRVLHEVWSTGDNARHTGDITQCYIDDVPKQVGEYQKFISSIIDEREFRMITDIHYFLSLDNKIQREYLCSMAGVSELKDICKGNKEWLEFLDEITGKSLSDFLKILDAERKRLKDDESKIAPMIEALENSLPEESGSREEAEKLKKDILAELEL